MELKEEILTITKTASSIDLEQLVELIVHAERSIHTYEDVLLAVRELLHDGLLSVAGPLVEARSDDI